MTRNLMAKQPERNHRAYGFNPIPPGLFWSSWAWGGGGGLKLETRLGGYVEHYYLIDLNRTHANMTS